MIIIPNEPKYWEFIRKLRNANKAGFVQQEDISQHTHFVHMCDYAKCYYVCLDDNNEPVGYCGVIRDDIRFAVDQSKQGQGIGTFMIDWLIKKFPDAQAKVKIDNEASRKVFEKCGFKLKFYILEKEKNA